METQIKKKRGRPAKAQQLPLSSTKKFHLSMKLNDEVFETGTDSLEEAILSFKPKVLKTKVLFTIKKGDTVCERQVFVQRAKMIFRSKLFLQTFVRNLIFK